MPSLAPKACLSCLSICYVILLRLCRYPSSRNELYSLWSVKIHVLDDFLHLALASIDDDAAIKFASVAHNKMQFTKRHSKTRLTGTQALDKVWSHLKRSVPKSLCSRNKSDRRFNPRMEQYVYSYMFQQPKLVEAARRVVQATMKKNKKRPPQKFFFFAGSQFPM